MGLSYSINASDKLPHGVKDIAENAGVLLSIIRNSPDALLGGFWKIEGCLDATDADFRGVGFLAGIETEAMVKKFWFFKFPPRGNREILLFKSATSLYSMREANVQMTPQADLAFKLNVMLAPSYCSPEFLPRLFANIRDLYMEGALKVDFNQMLSQLPSAPTPGSNWQLVLEFVREMNLHSK